MGRLNRKPLAWLVVLMLGVAGAGLWLVGKPLNTTKRSPMIFETIVVGQLGVNCFILGDPASREGIIVDPGAEPELILAAVKRHGLTIGQVINRGARGPMGLEELTSYKWIGWGTGQVRG